MNHPVTFFHKRQQGAGYSYAFDLKSPKRVYRVFVYSRRKVVDEAVVKNRPLIDLTTEMNRIFHEVGPGGIVVQVYEEEEKRCFQVSPVGTADSNFGSFGVLRPGSEMFLEEAKLEKWIETPAGTHVLVPVDRDAEKQLQGLKRYLEWLPADLESLVLYAIRKPSLDARIKDLEDRSVRDARPPAMGQTREKLLLILLVLIALLNFGILLLNSALFLQTPQKTDGSAGKSNIKSTQTADPQQPDPQEAAKHDQKIFAILQAVQGKAQSIPAFEGLRKGNFAGLDQEQDVTTALKNKTQTTVLVLGLMKLEALRLDATKAPDELFTISNNPSALKNVFQQIGKKAVDNDKKARHLLAALGCQAHGVPGLPKSRPQGGLESPAYLFAQSSKCDDFSLEKATPGLEDLLDFVKQYSPS